MEAFTTANIVQGHLATAVAQIQYFTSEPDAIERQWLRLACGNVARRFDESFCDAINS